MNKTAIRNFAVWARNKLIADVSYQAGLMGISRNGIKSALQQSTDNIEFYDIGASEPYAIRDEQIRQRKSLVDIIKAKEKDSDYVTAYNSVVEEVAYTWFNRLIAVRFMEVNDYLPSHVRVLSSDSGKQEPDIVTTPFDAELCFGEGEEQEIIRMKNENKLDEVFRILFIKQCRELSLLLPRLFEGTNDYTELLLNLSFIDQDGVVYHLVNDISENDFNVEKGGQVEIIGWLYQYYNAELKDETFALLKNNVKVTKERIPSATQLFTPDWIVRYMVENSLGRLWVEGHPNDLLKSKWKYYLDEVEQEDNIKAELEKIRIEYAKLNPEDIKVIDPCMGSGHILVYAFDVLMQIYERAGYTQRDAAKSILENNLYGLDIDDRAAQLAYFAVMMKARQYNRRILDSRTDCNVYAIKESNDFDRNALVKLGDDLRPVAEKLLNAFIDAKEYGSIITVDVTVNELDALDKRLDDVDKMSDYGNLLDMMYASILCTELSVLIKQARVMVRKYDVVVTNPPYMGAGNMNKKLSSLIKKTYPLSKSDLCTVFVEKCISMVKPNGLAGFMTSYTWMFIASFEKFRKWLLSEIDICSLVQPEYHAFFESANVPICAFTVSRMQLDFNGTYIKLSDFYGADVQEKHYLNAVNKNCDYRYYSKKSKISRIDGCPIAYWASDKFLEPYGNKRMDNYCTVTNGLFTCDNIRFLRLWYEVSDEEFFSNCECKEKCINSNKKWYPYNKGGDFRRWYGNHDYVVNFRQFGKEVSEYRVKSGQSASFPGQDFYFFPSISWTLVSSSKVGVRYYPQGFVFDIAGSSVFSNDRENQYYILGFLASEVALNYLKMTNPTINFQAGDVKKLPIIMNKAKSEVITQLVKNNCKMSKDDWDSFETSWNFKKHPLI